ncbi:site-specific integrase [Paraburkholderia sp. CNPSo 3076]|uniref:site-specific integrase n=1 Tax=Paraburkholderia sp. CNPSo 3076 TaxID=2940936 RepID=UPI0022529D41|nr:site-specific integrase [Paraburkholderia sp. CNPSo 3076]MCX5545507.1 site-specific integrase [Paraburkholderia sp. CNPSo 3076]
MKPLPSAALFTRVESFFTDNLRSMRGASEHTVHAYRDSLKLYFEFVATNKRCSLSAIALDDMNAETVSQFLAYLEKDRSNSVATRNCRRSAIRSFFRHLLRTDIAHSQQYARALVIPAKKVRHRPATYLEAEEVRALLARPDPRTGDGCRDYALLLFLYNTGARVSEAADLCWRDLQLAAPRQVRLHGKGRKDRVLPLWRETVNALHRLWMSAHPDQQPHVFLNRRGEVLSRDGIAYILRRHVQAATQDFPGLARKRITPHVLRHSCAVSLLQSGTDITVIRDYLGHVSIATTGRYVATNLQMKRDALETFWKHAGIQPAKAKPWKPTPNLLAFLNSL